MTINELMTKTLVGKYIKVYEFDAKFTKLGTRNSYYHTCDDDEELHKVYDNNGVWTDLIVREHILPIKSISGHYETFEGIDIVLVLDKGGEDKTIHINCDDKLMIVDKEGDSIAWYLEV